MAQLPVYSSKNVKVAFLGFTIDGLSPDSFVEFSLSSDLTDEEVGADGSVSVSISPDETGTCTISLQQNSPSNIFLSGILARQRSLGKLATGALTIVDPSGSVVATLSQAHIKTAELNWRLTVIWTGIMIQDPLRKQRTRMTVGGRLIWVRPPILNPSNYTIDPTVIGSI